MYTRKQSDQMRVKQEFPLPVLQILESIAGFFIDILLVEKRLNSHCAFIRNSMVPDSDIMYVSTPMARESELWLKKEREKMRLLKDTESYIVLCTYIYEMT